MRNLTIEFLLTFFLPEETKVFDIYLFTGMKTPAICGGHIYNLVLGKIIAARLRLAWATKWASLGDSVRPSAHLLPTLSQNSEIKAHTQLVMFASCQHDESSSEVAPCTWTFDCLGLGMALLTNCFG